MHFQQGLNISKWTDLLRTPMFLTLFFPLLFMSRFLSSVRFSFSVPFFVSTSDKANSVLRVMLLCSPGLVLNRSDSPLPPIRNPWGGRRKYWIRFALKPKLILKPKVCDRDLLCYGKVLFFKIVAGYGGSLEPGCLCYSLNSIPAW